MALPYGQRQPVSLHPCRNTPTRRVSVPPCSRRDSGYVAEPPHPSPGKGTFISKGERLRRSPFGSLCGKPYPRAGNKTGSADKQSPHQAFFNGLNHFSQHLGHFTISWMVAFSSCHASSQVGHITQLSDSKLIAYFVIDGNANSRSIKVLYL